MAVGNDGSTNLCTPEITITITITSYKIKKDKEIVKQPKQSKNYESEYRKLKELVCNLVDPTLDLESQECEKDFLDRATGGKGHL